MKILHLEDSARDAEVFEAVLLAEWPDCTVTVAARREQYVAALQAGEFDLILSDFNMLSFDGLDALQLARERAPATPFIFLSGTIGEDRAVDAMRSGATDYVIKDRPKRLVSAIKRALADAQHLRERREAQEQLLRVQRLENIGMLAAGIAHDFNNVLAPVMMGVAFLREAVKGEAESGILTSIENSVQRGAGLVRQILGFAQGVTGEAQLMQARHLTRDLVTMLRQTFPPAIEIVHSIAADLWPLKANPTQLHQVLLNLCVNARDAMPNGGTLTIRVSNHELDEVSAAGITGARKGPYLLFELADTGTGIPPEVQNRIWEPFFTTKEKGRGTGLGLPTVRGIVERHQGVIKLHSRVGCGTTFQVYFPATPGSELFKGDSENTELPRGSGETILLVDDDENLRDVTAAILSHHGYRVLTAANGTEAVALFAPRTLEVRVVVTDLGMPHLDGVALAKVVESLSPSTRILAISGLPDASERLSSQQFSHPFLSKPFTAESLLVTIKQLLTPSSSTVRDTKELSACLRPV